MEFSTLRCHYHPIPQGPKKSSASFQYFPKFQLSRFFFLTLGRAHLFYISMLTLVLTLLHTYNVGAITFAFNGFEENNVYMASNSPWTFQSNTSCFYFNPPQASWNKSVSGRFLYPNPVQVKDTVTKQVKSFSTTFIYQIQTNCSTFGPGMSFIMVPDNITVGAALDHMGLFTMDSSTSSKNYKSDNHTLGIELDTFKNPEFEDPSNNHIGLNLASMNSNFVIDLTYPLASIQKDIYRQIWIDYVEVDFRMDISIAPYGKGKPLESQGSQRGVNLSLLLEDMYIGFSTAKGIESDNVPYVYAWSFSNDGIPAPPIDIGFNATPTTPLANEPFITPLEEPSSSPLILISPIRSPPSNLMDNSPSRSGRVLKSTSTMKKKSLGWQSILGIVVSIFLVGMCMGLFWRCIVFQHPLHIIISHESTLDGSSENFSRLLHCRIMLLLKSRAKIFFEQDDIDDNELYAQKILEELARFDLGIVVVTREYFEKKWCMIELIAFVEAQCNDQRNRIRILPLFYGLTRDDLKIHLNDGTWEDNWKEMANGHHPIEVEKCKGAVKWLCSRRNIQYDLQRQGHDIEYINRICEKVKKILSKERSFSSNVFSMKTTIVEKINQMPLIGTSKKKKQKNLKIQKKRNLTTYVNTRLQFLFVLFGLLNIFFSIILDKFFNDLPIRFISFAILTPLMIFWGFLASGWFPQIPLRFIAFIKQHGFVQDVMPCSPWHDNIVTNFCGKICYLKPLEEGEERRQIDFPMSVQNFLYGNQISLQEIVATTTTHSSFDLEIQHYVATNLVQEGEDVQGQSTSQEMFDLTPSSPILDQYHLQRARREVLFQILHVHSPYWKMAENIGRFSAFHILDDERVPILEFDGPSINGFPMTIQASKDLSTKDCFFYLSCTLRDRKTKNIYLTPKRLQNLVHNMCRWVENPYPIVVDESSGILHCISIEDILWKFTKMVYSLKQVHVEHRLLAGLGHIKFFIGLSYGSISFVLSLIPLVSDKRSLFFLFFLFILVPYLIALDDANPLTFYFIKSLFCPIFIKIFGFNRLYKSRSSFRWCNEFRKKKIVNPTFFWIDEEYANTCPHAASCLEVCGFVELPSRLPKDQSFTITCKGWPRGNLTTCKKQHDYLLKVKFDCVKVIDNINCYINVRLSFFENDYILGERNYNAIEVERVHLIEELFDCFSNPSFGGYVEKICLRDYCSTTYVAHCPRFIDFCHTIFSSNLIPKVLVARQMLGSKFVVGVPFWSL